MSAIKSFVQWIKDGEVKRKEKLAAIRAERYAKKYPNKCPNCGSGNVKYSFENIKHKRNIAARTVGVVGKVAFVPATFGLSLLLPTSKKTDTFRVGTCEDCRYYWTAGKVGRLK